MKPKFETVKMFSRFMLAVGGLTLALAPFGHALPDIWMENLNAVGGSFVQAVAITLVAFFAFPDMRRADLVRLAVTLGALMFAGQHLCGAPLRLASVVGWSAGALAVVAVSYSERVRSATRRTPYAKFSLAVQKERRHSGFGKSSDVAKSSGAALGAQ